MGTISNTIPLVGGRRQALPNSPRLCRFEQLERRQLLAADLTVGAAEVPLVSPGGATASISGTVYSAPTEDCQDHQVASAQADARVQLLNVSGHVLEAAFTDESGTYYFVDLLPGQYAVRQITAHGYLDGASVVGTGGGVALDANLVSEIVVHGGEDLTGYDFCDVVNQLDPTGPTDVPIVPHETATIERPFLTPEIPSSVTSQSLIVANSLFQSMPEPPSVVQPPLVVVQVEVSYNGGGRLPEEPTSIKTWDEFRYDDWFSMSSHLEIAATNLPTIEALGSIIGPPESASDVAFADGYTVNSIEWWDELAEIDLSELIDEGETSGQDVAPAERPSTKVAQRDEPQQTQ